MSNLINYNDGEIEVAISIKEDTIWLSQKQIVELFDKFDISKVRITAVVIPALFLIIYFLNPAEVPKYEKTISENKKLEGGM